MMASDGSTALTWASEKGHTEIVETLMARPDYLFIHIFF